MPLYSRPMASPRPDHVARLGPREVLGVPVLPPGRVAAWATRLRQTLGRANRGMVPPPVQILEGVFGLLDYGGLVVLCDLGIPDALVGWTAIDDLAGRLNVRAEPLERLLRYGAARGWLRMDRRGRIGPNGVTRFLRADHPGGWSAWVGFAGGSDVLGAVRALGHAVRSGDDAFATANGASFFEWMANHPARGRAFDAAMSAGGHLHGLALAATLDWSGSSKVCDVGGGNGSLLGTLLASQPHLEGVLVDLPEVTARAQPADRLEIRAGDAFAAVPTDCDTYLFVNVIHDWDDDDAVRLLARAVADSPSRARIVVVEGHRTAPPADDIATRTDLLMLALAPGGRERTAREFAKLGERAGLYLKRSIPLPSADFAHLFTH
jgi:hypothetical protein